ncbi:hypothetical protein [Pseudonocardia sp. GCM10023141]
MSVEIDRHIARAARHDIELTPSDFRLIDGGWYLDGMDPAEWIDAMTMD